MKTPPFPAVPPVPPVPPVRPVPPVIQFGGNTGEIPADQHLQDAQLHLRRACIALKAAAQADPGLLVKLGSRHAVLVEQLGELEGER